MKIDKNINSISLKASMESDSYIVDNKKNIDIKYYLQ